MKSYMKQSNHLDLKRLRPSNPSNIVADWRDIMLDGIGTVACKNDLLKK